MKIAISTGTYPPEIGGSSDYASHLAETLRFQSHEVATVTYGKLRYYTTGVRHLLYFFKLIQDAYDAEYVISLDAFSVGLPTLVFATLFRKKIVVRLGGDFLWEAYADRTRQPILLSDFYTSKIKFSVKEKITFSLIRFVLRSVDMVVFSTEWQRDITLKPYKLSLQKTMVIENCYALPSTTETPEFQEKIILSPSRDRYIKNKKNLEEAFQIVHSTFGEVVLDTEVTSYELLLDRISKAYMVVVPSFSEVSPNLVLHALEYDVPVVMTSDTGIKERLEGRVVFVDPLQVEDITRGITSLLDPYTYTEYKNKIRSTTFSHSWNEIAQEFLDLYKAII